MLSKTEPRNLGANLRTLKGEENVLRSLYRVQIAKFVHFFTTTRYLLVGRLAYYSNITFTLLYDNCISQRRRRRPIRLLEERYLGQSNDNIFINILKTKLKKQYLWENA